LVRLVTSNRPLSPLIDRPKRRAQRAAFLVSLTLAFFLMAPVAVFAAPSGPSPTPTPAPPIAAVNGIKSLSVSQDASGVVLGVPMRSQYDSSPYQYANCGPASLGMVLQAFGLPVPTADIRDLANHLQGTYGYDDGIALDYLQDIGRQAGLGTEGLYGSDGRYQRWSTSEISQEVQQGHPVITLVHYASLPNHLGAATPSDHYVVVVGVTTRGFLINDPASVDNAGFRQLVTPNQLLDAWNASSIPEQAVAFLPRAGGLASRLGVSETVRQAPTPQPSTSETRLAAARSPAVAPPTSTATPAPNPTLVAWARELATWNPTTSPVATPGDRSLATAASTPTTFSPPRPSPVSPLPLFGVLTLIFVGTVGVLAGVRSHGI